MNSYASCYFYGSYLCELEGFIEMISPAKADDTTADDHQADSQANESNRNHCCNCKTFTADTD